MTIWCSGRELLAAGMQKWKEALFFRRREGFQRVRKRISFIDKIQEND